MNKKLWVGIYLASFFTFLSAGLIDLSCYLLMNDDVIAYRQGLYNNLALLAGLAYLQFAIVATVYNFAVLAKMWSAIQDDESTITAGKAIGYLFIPLFNVYWIFKTWGSYPYEYNEFAARNRLGVPILSSRAGVISADDRPDLTYTAKSLYDLVSNPNLPVEIRVKNQYKLNGKIVKVTGKVKQIGGKSTHLMATAADWVTCYRDPETESLFNGLFEGEDAVFMGVGRNGSLNHCIVVR